MQRYLGARCLHSEVIEATHNTLMDLQSKHFQGAQRRQQEAWLGGAADSNPCIVGSSFHLELEDY